MKRILASALVAITVSALFASHTHAQRPVKNIGKKKSTLTLLSLECYQTNDDNPKTDEIELRVFFSDGRVAKFSGTMNKLQKQDRALAFPKHVQGPHVIAGDIRVELWDIDKGPFEKDDKLGWFVVRPGDRLGKKVATLKSGAHYVLHFEVSR
jgi:hypothetical protein